MAAEPLNVTTQGASGVSPAGRTPLPLPPPPVAPLPPGSPANAPRDGALSTTPAPARGVPPPGAGSGLEQGAGGATAGGPCHFIASPSSAHVHVQPPVHGPR